MQTGTGTITDAFISYSRKNLNFATKLNEALKGIGLETWFDQEDIPFGVDFMRQIEDGIRHTDTFLFVITPDSVSSQYCRAEIETATKYKKRIIPLLYIDLDESSDWERMHPSIGRINWLFFQGEADFGAAFQNLETLLASQKEYVRLHTDILLEALEWEEKSRVEVELMAGHARLDAEAWLTTQFGTAQPPCRPTDLHAEFICESKKNAFNLMTEAFLCKAPSKDSLIATFRMALMHHGITCWSHAIDIKPGSDAGSEGVVGIEQADNFVLFISKEQSIPDAQREAELEYALSLNKRNHPCPTR